MTRKAARFHSLGEKSGLGAWASGLSPNPAPSSAPWLSLVLPGRADPASIPTPQGPPGAPPCDRRREVDVTWPGGGVERSQVDPAGWMRRGPDVPRGTADRHLDHHPARPAPDFGPRRRAAGLVEPPVVRLGALDRARAPPAGEGRRPGRRPAA